MAEINTEYSHVIQINKVKVGLKYSNIQDRIFINLCD